MRWNEEPATGSSDVRRARDGLRGVQGILERQPTAPSATGAVRGADLMTRDVERKEDAVRKAVRDLGDLQRSYDRAAVRFWRAYDAADLPCGSLDQCESRRFPCDRIGLPCNLRDEKGRPISTLLSDRLWRR